MPDLFEKCTRFHEAEALQKAGLYPYFQAIRASEGTEVEIDGRHLVMAGSNNYLGLTHDQRVKTAAAQAIEDYGSGCTGSRFLNGTLELHEELERRLALFTERETALTFSTGFQTNLGIISCLVGRDDVIFCDRDNHASIIDGCRLAFGALRKFRHNDMADLERCLRNTEPSKGKFIVVDGVYSMFADIAPLDAICDLAERYGARILVDEAHSIGVLGAHGRGACEHYGVEDRVDLVMGTFSKSLASLGGFVAGRREIVHFIQHHARALIFSASIAPASVMAATMALEVLQAEPERRARLMEIAAHARQALRSAGLYILGDITPIVPVVVGERVAVFRFWKRLFERGVFTNPVTSPAVPPGMDLIRISFMSTHTDEQVEAVIAAVVETAREFGTEMAQRPQPAPQAAKSDRGTDSSAGSDRAAASF